MKLLAITILLASIYCASAGKTARMLAAMNAMNAMGLGGNPAAASLLAAGVNPLLVPGAAGLAGQPQFPQFAPGLPAFGVRVPMAPVPMYPIPVAGPAANQQQYAFMGVAPMAAMNPVQPLPQQQAMGGLPMGNQPLPAQPGAMLRFRRQVTGPLQTADTTVDTQISPPTDVPLPCSNEVQSPNQ